MPVLKTLSLNKIANPFAPIHFDDLDGDFVVDRGMSSAQGTIIFYEERENYFWNTYYAPAGNPSAFYELNLFRNEGGDHYGFHTHAKKDMYLFPQSGAVSFVAFSSTTPEYKEHGWEIFPHAEPWKNLTKAECSTIRNELSTGDKKLYSLPTEWVVDEAFALPPGHKTLNGSIVFCKRHYLGGVDAFFVPRDRKQRTRAIAFYKGEERPSYNDIKSSFSYRYVHTLSVSLDNENRMDVDFTGARRFSPFHPRTGDYIGIHNHLYIKALIRNGRIPGVPVRPTPLITPLLNKIERGL